MKARSIKNFSFSARRTDSAEPAFCCFGGGGYQPTVLQIRRYSGTGTPKLLGEATKHYRLSLRPHAYLLHAEDSFRKYDNARTYLCEHLLVLLRKVST